MNTIYYRDAQGAVIVYDITDVDSFQRMSDWVKELRNQLGNGIPIIILANKADLESRRQVELEQGESYARSLGLHHFSVSAKTNTNLHDAFANLTQQMIQTLS